MNGKNEQIQLLLEAEGWKTNIRGLLEWLLLVSVMTEYFIISCVQLNLFLLSD